MSPEGNSSLDEVLAREGFKSNEMAILAAGALRNALEHLPEDVSRREVAQRLSEELAKRADSDPEE